VSCEQLKSFKILNFILLTPHSSLFTRGRAPLGNVPVLLFEGSYFILGKMTQAKPFRPVKLICGIIFSQEIFFKKAEENLCMLFGFVDFESPLFDFDLTDYYEKEMGKRLKRKFLSFESLIAPERLSAIKLETNALEEKIKQELNASFRVVNIDPGYVTSSALVMATAKDFSHRIPLQRGIYAHLEFMFTKTGIKILDWTYPDFRKEEYQKFFLDVRKIYLTQIKSFI
jgi:hypothetical protein